MTIAWYSISIKKDAAEIFNGYFIVDDSTNLVTSFYKTINGSIDFNDILVAVPSNTDTSPKNDNKFPVSTRGIALAKPILYGEVSYNKIIDYGGKNYKLFNSDSWAELGNIIVSILPTNPIPIPTSNPISNICFPSGTPITCNQGNIPIEKINPNIHTIRNKKIVGITKTITKDKYLVCFEKDSLGNNFPSQKTIISKNHRIFYKNNMRQAKQFVGINDKIYKIKYRKEILYNVLMEEHDKMVVNNLVCETLHPKNGTAKLYRYLQYLNPEEQNDTINIYNEYIIKNKIFTSKK